MTVTQISEGCLSRSCGVPGVSPWLPLRSAHFNYTLEVKVCLTFELRDFERLYFPVFFLYCCSCLCVRPIRCEHNLPLERTPLWVERVASLLGAGMSARLQDPTKRGTINHGMSLETVPVSSELYTLLIRAQRRLIPLTDRKAWTSNASCRGSPDNASCCRPPRH